MNKFAITLLTTTIISGCSTLGNPQNQSLSTSVPQEGIKVSTKCTGYFSKTCSTVQIDSTGTAVTNGTTAASRSVAMLRACDNARASLRHWRDERVLSDRYSSTNGDSQELSKSTTSNNTNGNSNVNTSSNVNYNVTHDIHVQASGQLSGFKVVRQEVVGPQEVSCTIQWNESDSNSLTNLSRAIP